MSEERAEVSVRAEGPTHEELLNTLRELRTRATLLDLLCRALAPLAYSWCALALFAAGWGVTLGMPTIPRMVAASIASVFLAGFVLIAQYRKGTP